MRDTIAKQAVNKQTTQKKTMKRRTRKASYSKQLIHDIRSLLWIVTVGSLLLAFYCIKKGYIGSLPWISALVGLPWSAHGVVCTAYLKLARSDHREGGITFETAKANNFQESYVLESPPI